MGNINATGDPRAYDAPDRSRSVADGLNMLPRIGEPETSFPGAGKPVGDLLAFSAPNIPDTGGPGPTPLQQPGAWTYDFDPTSGSARATFNGEVFPSGGGGSGDVTSFNGRTGAITLTTGDVTGAGGASLVSPALSGSPTAPTPAPGDSSTLIPTTAFVQQAIANAPKVGSFNGRTGAVSLVLSDVTSAGGAPVVSPALTGIPTTPTGSQGAGGSQIASQAYVESAIAAETVTSFNGRHGEVALTLSDVQSVGGAPIASPSFTGLVSVPTATPGAATTQAASTAFVTNAITAGTAGVSSVNTRTGAIVLNAADLAAMGGAPILSPALTGTPTAPTASAGVATTQLATCAFVANAIASEAAGVTSFNGRTGTVTLALTDVTSIGGAPLAAPTFSGLVHAPTPTAGDNSTLVATTAFVDGAIAAIPAAPAASTTTPLMDGTAAIGAGAMFARNDHVHPTDTSRAAASALANYLPLAGGTLSGNLALSPGNVYVGGGNLIIGPTAGTSPLLSMPSAGALNIWNYSGGSLSSINLYAANINLNASNTINCAGMVNSSSIVPSVNNNYYCGITAYAWTGVYSYYFGTVSDVRTKTEIESLPDCLGVVRTLDAKRFKWKNPNPDDPHRNATHWGFIAQDVQAAMAGTPFGGHRVEEGGEHSLNYNELVAVLWKACQELAARVETLEEKLAAA